VAARLAALLDDPRAGALGRDRAADPPGDVVFVFSGQGAQWPRMGLGLLEQEPVCAEVLRQCDELFRGHAAWSLLEEISAGGGQSRLDRTEIAQPALFAIQVALAALWRSWGVAPKVVIGHSVGEVAAAYVAGALTLADAVQVVFHRGRVMQPAHGRGKMAAVALPLAEAERLAARFGQRLEVAVINGPNSTVLAGEPAALSQALAQLGERVVFQRMLRVEFAYHTAQMEAFQPELERALRDIRPQPSAIPLISTVTGEPIRGTDLGAAYWARNIRAPVRFAAAFERLERSAQPHICVEVSPHPVLAQAISQNLEQRGQQGVVVASMRRGQDERATMLAALGSLYGANYPLDWGRLYPSGGRYVALPSYPWQRARYWVDIPDEQRPLAAAPSGRETNHPLLGRRVRSPQPLFETQIGSAGTPFLADHRIYDQAVLPLTASIEMVRAAVAQAGGPAPAELADLVLHEALLLPDEAERLIQVLLTPQGRSGFAFQLFSLAGGSGDGQERWTLHVSGQARQQQPAEPARVQLDELAGSLQPVAVETFYDRLRASGIGYGRSFAGVRQLWREDGAALGRIVLPEQGPLEAERYLAHPALLDPCLQVTLASLPSDARDVYLPVGLERFRCFARPGTQLWSYARTQRTSDATATGELRIVDDEGAIVALFEGLHLKRAEQSALQRLDRQPLEEWCYELAWEPLPRAAAAAARPPGAWLVFADSSGVGNALAELLQAHGEQPILVAPAAEAGSPSALSCDPTVRDAMTRLWEQASAAARLPWRGIVHLWSLDAPAGDLTLEALEAAQDLGCRSALYLAQELTARSDASPPRLWLVTRGSQAAGSDRAPVAAAQAPLWGLGRVLAQEQPELQCTCVDLDPAMEEGSAQALFETIWHQDREDQLALRGRSRYAARLMPAKLAPRAAAEQPQRLTIAERGLLENLALQPSTRRPPGHGEIEIRVYANGLNFRDVLNALGMYPGPAGPLGLECAGEIVAVGEGVAGLAAGDVVIAMAADSFSTFATVPAALVAAKPGGLSFAEAATIPIAFLTAAYGLQQLAQIKPGDRVLIHAAAGGVGMAAVQLARRAGAEVYATASSGKWPLLERMGLRHVMSSRTLEFADQVRALSGGRGIDIVLNSLSDDFIPASLELLRPGGRFIEIGKRGILTAEQAAQLRPDVAYLPFDLGDVAQSDPGLIQTMLRDLVAAFDSGALHPLPQHIFRLTEAVAAFRYMAQARHSGKIVLLHDGAATHGLRKDGTYVITGGLGALGLHVARWLAEQGAKRLVLVGRHAAQGDAARTVEELAQRAQVEVKLVDVGDRAAVARLFDELDGARPRLRGVFHAAGVLDDRLLRRQSWESFARVLAPKLAGAWNLHAATRHMELDCFVLFSSVSSLLGTRGQSNYAAANSFLDALAHHRQERGLRAISINWGPWAEGGMAAAVGSQGQRRWAAQGFGHLTPAQGLQILERLIVTDAAQVVALPLDWSAYARQFAPGAIPPLFAHLASTEAAQPPAAAAGTPVGALRERLNQATPGERLQLLQDYIRAQATNVLGLPPTQTISLQQPLGELGLDSLMAVELRNVLGAAVGLTLPTTIVFEHPTIARLAVCLARELFPDDAARANGSQAAEDAPGDDAALAIAELEEDEVAALLDQRLAALDERFHDE
jgi:acyl transferase domain-containing protein